MAKRDETTTSRFQSMPFVARERPKPRGTVLVIDDKVPEVDKHAGGVFIAQCLELLVGEGFKVVFAPDDRTARQPYTTALQRLGIETLYGRMTVERWLIANGPDLPLAIVARPHIAAAHVPAIRRHSKARIFYYTHDLHYLREQRRYQTTGDPRALRNSEASKALELHIFAEVDEVLTPSGDEARTIRELTGRRARVLTPWFEPMQPSASTTPLAARNAILFVGGFDHTPNVDAASFLATEIMPAIWRAVPTAQLMIVGNRPTTEVLELAGDRVTVTGYVPDLAPYYELARVTLNPLRFGAGVKGKILASLQYGVPVITTTIGNEGIGLEHGRDALLADAADELAAQAVRLFQDTELLQAIAAGGSRFLSEHFGHDHARAALLAALTFQQGAR